MPHLTDLTGLLGIACVIAALSVSLCKPLSQRKPALFIAAIFLVALLPISGLPLAAYVRGIFGDLSITSIVLALATLLRPYYATALHRSRTPLLILIVLAALFLYPMTLGMSLYDPYRLGYGDMTMVGVVLVIACFAWLAHISILSACLALAILAWSIGWYESTNLWDYLIDPMLAIYALYALLLHAAKTIRAAVFTGSPQ